MTLMLHIKQHKTSVSYRNKHMFVLSSGAAGGYMARDG